MTLLIDSTIELHQLTLTLTLTLTLILTLTLLLSCPHGNEVKGYGSCALIITISDFQGPPK